MTNVVDVASVSMHDVLNKPFSGPTTDNTSTHSKTFDLPIDRNLYITKTTRLDFGSTVEDIRQYFHSTYDIYEQVFACMNCDEAFFERPVHKLRHPMIFYYGHTAAFYMNKLALAGLTTRINPRFEEIFAVGVDEMSWDDLNTEHYDWPTVSEVTEYRILVRKRLDDLMRGGGFQLNLPLTFTNCTDNNHNAFWWTMIMGIEHERIHLETATVHIRELPLKFLRRSDFWSNICTETGDAPKNELKPVKGGDVSVGRALNHVAYGWDCDYGSDMIEVDDFKASKYLVSNQEFYEFVQAGGYNTQKYWDEEGWSWVSWKKPEHPWFWVKGEDENSFRLRVQDHEITLPWDWPCEVNNLEATAFCSWKSEQTGKNLRLPTEVEWMRMHDLYVKQDQFEWEEAPGNINCEHHLSSCPVNKYKQGDFYDIVGNAWQHTCTPVYPYQGYRVHPHYDDFSMPTFDGRHVCMKGGTWISTGNEATRDSRYAFRRHFFQFIGIRYVEAGPVDETQFLKTALGLDPEVDAAADFDFGTDLLSTGNFAERLAGLSKEFFAKHAEVEKPKRALALLCGAGRLAFELTDIFDEVIGSDVTARQLQTAYAIRERGESSYSVIDDFGEREARVIQSKEYTWNATREKAFFYQADPTNLHAHMTRFDLIIAYGALERTYRPQIVPAHLLERLNPGGLLVFASHYQWNPQNAPRSEWIRPSKPSSTVREEIKALIGASATEAEEPHFLLEARPVTSRKNFAAQIEVLVFLKSGAQL